MLVAALEGEQAAFEAARSWQLFGVSADTPVWLKRLAVAAGQSAKE